MDRGTWQDTVHGVAKSRTQLSNCHSPPLSTRLLLDYGSLLNPPPPPLFTVFPTVSTLVRACSRHGFHLTQSKKPSPYNDLPSRPHMFTSHTTLLIPKQSSLVLRHSLCPEALPQRPA